MAERYKKLRGFIDDLVLEPPTSPADMVSPRGARSSATQTLTLSTVHSAKGLEWPVSSIQGIRQSPVLGRRTQADVRGIHQGKRQVNHVLSWGGISTFVVHL